MLKKMSSLLTILLAAALPVSALAQPVIPGGVGFGMETPAGRGGDIIRVTNLNASGAGSLKACVAASGPRTCVFEVSGTIRLSSNLSIENPYLTIAGQTAPAPGIMIRGASVVIRASHVLMQHIAVRPGDSLDGPELHYRDALKISGTRGPVRNVVIDHCSFSWAIDEVVEVWGEEWDNVTFSHNIFSEPLRDAPPEAGKDQGYGVLVDSTPGRIAFIGNVFAHVHNRNPRTAAAKFVFVNNVVYNPGIIQLNLFNSDGLASKNSIVGNIFINGRDTSFKMPVLLNGVEFNGELNSILSSSDIYIADNAAAVATSDPWSIVKNNSDVSFATLRVSTAPVWPANLQALSTGDGVLNWVLKRAGARPGQRGTVDSRIVEDVRNGTGRIINCVSANGTTRCQKNAGGWPKLAVNTRRLSIPASPNGDSDGDGYTNAEEWLHAMALQVEGRTASEEPEDPVEPPTEPPSPSRPRPPHVND